jgi:hypothetical protein
MTTDFPHGIRSQGVPVLGGGGMMTQGNSYFVDPTNGSDSNDGKTAATAKATIAAGEELLTANQNDVLYVMGGSTANTLTASLTWDKSYTHLIGVGAPCHDSQRTRIFHNANFSPMITVSASGCSFQNLYFSYGRGGADNHILMTVTGSRNYFENVHFSGMSNQTEADDAESVILFLNGCESNYFNGCNFGNQNVQRGAANTIISVDGSTKRNKFKECLFQCQADAATPTFVTTVDATAVDQIGLWFHDCIFNAQGTALTQAMNLHNMGGNRQIVCSGTTMFIGVTDVADATGDQQIKCLSHTATATAVMLAISPTA